MFGFRRQAAGTGAIIVLVIIAWISLEIGHTFGTALTIFSVLVWAGVALMFAYMILFRNLKLRFFRDDQDQLPIDGMPGYGPGAAYGQAGLVEVPDGTLVELHEGDVVVRGGDDV